MGVDVGRVDVLLHVRACEGLVRYPNGALLKKWAAEETLHPLQATLQRNPAPDPRLTERGPETAGDQFPPGSTAICLCEPYYGQLCTVLEVQKGDTFVVSLFPSPPLDHISQRILAGGGVSYTRYRKPGARKTLPVDGVVMSWWWRGDVQIYIYIYIK
eukprot:1085235-Prorocentrum_minimum.AAC.2